MISAFTALLAASHASAAPPQQVGLQLGRHSFSFSEIAVGSAELRLESCVSLHACVGGGLRLQGFPGVLVEDGHFNNLRDYTYTWTDESGELQAFTSGLMFSPVFTMSTMTWLDSSGDLRIYVRARASGGPGLARVRPIAQEDGTTLVGREVGNYLAVSGSTSATVGFRFSALALYVGAEAVGHIIYPVVVPAEGGIGIVFGVDVPIRRNFSRAW